MRRILFMHVSPDVPQALSYGTFNAASIKPAGFMTMGANNLGATRNATSAGFGAVRGTIALNAGRYYLESVPIVSTTLNYTYFGFANSQLAAYESADGNTALSMMMHCGNGRLNYNGVAGAILGQILSTDIVRWWIDFDARTLRIAKNGGAWTVAASGWTGQGSWYPTITSQQSTFGWRFLPGGGAGASAFAYSLPDGVTKPYAFQPAPTPTLQTLATRCFTGPEYLAGFVPPLPFTYYDGRISTKSDVTLKRAVSCVVWGGNSTGANPVIGSIDFWNGDGGLDAWLDYGWRDKVAELYYCIGDPPSVVSDGTRFAFAIIDRIESRGDVMRMVFSDWLAKLQKPAQIQNFRKQAEANVKLQRAIADVGENNEGRPVPFVLGVTFQTNPPLVNSTTREYQNADAPMSSFVAYDKCDDFQELVTGVDILRPSQTDGFRMAPSIAGPFGKVTMDSTGPAVRGTQRITLANGGDFTTWSGDNPVGWTVTTIETGTCRFTQSGAACRIQNDGTSLQSMRHDASSGAWPLGTLVEVQFTVTAVTTAGPIYCVLNSGLNQGVRRVQIYGAGIYRVMLALPAGATLYSFLLRSGHNVVAGDIVDVTIDTLEAWEVRPITQIADWLQNLVVDRGGFLTGDIEASTVTALATAFNPTLGFNATDSVNTLDILRQTMDSFTGWIYVDRVGKFRVGRLEDVSKQTPVISFEMGDVVGQVTAELDVARGLSTTFAGMRNWSPTDPNSMAGSVSLADRAKWSEKFQAVRTAQGIVHSTYAFADQAKARETLLQTSDNVRDEAARVATLYGAQRYFYRFTVNLNLDAANALNPGDVIGFTYPRYGLAAGRSLQLVEITHKFFSQSVDLVLWG